MRNLFLSQQEGIFTQTIHDELVQILGSDVIAYSMMTSYLGASRWKAQNEEQHSDPRPALSTIQFSKS
jgi:uncharacterized membrane protein YidH (DUF202 family)